MLLRPQTARSASVSEKWNHAMTSGDGVIVFWEQQWNEADSQDPDARSTCCARSSGICSRALSRRDGSAQRGPWLGNGRTCGPVADGPRPAGSRGADVALVAVPQVRLAAAGGPGVARARGRTALSCDLSSDQNQLAKGVTTGSSEFYVAHLIKALHGFNAILNLYSALPTYLPPTPQF